ncbi:MAG: alpha/beta hydrolase [Candidatus Hinthialibacter antarcticus]|nr:alpha/beta hydrolase [Candidatus Hinthialibacter antarcticus]
MKKYYPFTISVCLMIAVAQLCVAQDAKVEYTTKTDILYYENAASLEDAYINERCRLDLYYPTGLKDFPTIVWFHGGGLQAGNRSVPQALKEQGFAVAAVNYRLNPKVKCPAYIEDAAASVAWVMKRIDEFGGSPQRVFVSGHSAGGYLTSMVGLDKRWLAKHGVDADRIAGLIPFSGHTITHFTVRDERGIPRERPIVDKFAPLYHVRSDAPPIVFITGDREMEMLGRYEENAYMARMMKGAGHKATTLYELQGFDHGGMAKPAHDILVRFVKEIVSE